MNSLLVERFLVIVPSTTHDQCLLVQANLCFVTLARVGQKHSGDIMPHIDRAPEVILGMDWDSKVDIWTIGIMVRTA